MVLKKIMKLNLKIKAEKKNIKGNWIDEAKKLVDETVANRLYKLNIKSCIENGECTGDTIEYSWTLSIDDDDNLMFYLISKGKEN